MWRRSFNRYIWATSSGCEVKASPTAPVADSPEACVTIPPAQRYINARLGSNHKEKYNHSHLPSASFPSSWKGCFTRFFVALEAKTFYFTYTNSRPQGSVYQEMRYAFNQHGKTTVSGQHCCPAHECLCQSRNIRLTERKAKR